MRVRKSLALASMGVALVVSMTDAQPCSGDPSQLAVALKEGDPEVRRRAAVALGDCTPLPDVAFQALVLALDDPHPWVAGNALEALIPAGARAVAPLVERVQTRNGDDRTRFIYALARLGKPAVSTVGVLLDELRNRRLDHGPALIRAIRDLGGEEARAAVPLFVKLLDDTDLEEEAASAIAHLSASHPDRVIPILVRTLREQIRWEDWHTTADDDIAQYGELAMPVWVELLADRSFPSDVSLRALKALGPKAMSKAVPFLRSILDKPEWGISRMDAVRDLLDLGEITPDASAAVYESFLSHEFERWRLEAVAGLIRIGRTSDPRILDALHELADDRQHDVRERARALLTKLEE